METEGRISRLIVDELAGLLATVPSSLTSARNQRSRDRRISTYVEIVRSLLPKVHVKQYERKPFIYNGRWWEACEWKEVNAQVYTALLEMGVWAVDAVRVFKFVISTISEFTPDMSLVAFDNVLFDVKRLRFLRFDDSRYCVRHMDYKIAKGSRGKRFPAFLEEVLPDKRDRDAIQEFFGSIFVDRDKLALERFLLMIGSGANGKSVLLRCVSEAIGTENVAHLDPQQLTDGRMLEGLRGKLLNIASDVRSDAQLSSVLKPLVSHEAIEGWELYKGRVSVKAPPLVFAMNHIPVSKDLSEGMRRRMLPIVFSVTIPPEKRNPALADKIVAKEKSAVFNWIVEGARRLKRNNGVFTEPAESNRTVESISRVSLPVFDILTSMNLFPEPRYQGHPPEYMTIRDVMAVSQLGGYTAREVSDNMTRAGYQHVMRNGYKTFLVFRDDD